MNTISQNQLHAAFRALGLGSPAGVHSVTITPDRVAVNLGEIGETYEVEPAAEETGETYECSAHVTLNASNGARYEFHIDGDFEYLANVQNVAVTSGDETSDPEDVRWESTGVTYVDLHLYGRGIASQLAMADKPSQ
jgi:hypothetical protein